MITQQLEHSNSGRVRGHFSEIKKCLSPKHGVYYLTLF
uniref:Uncharacterized protein n=1 Tax=Podoviridae sp. cthau23 TaxID=2825268 RepID=A0A8S5U720_9CAUD|nr:MAG TPA: hypothetical protein [Podoviridae sp. cthau23]